ncbi:Transcription factor GTE3 [Phytophthora citrophthora]|uniref:Transcription factor GTE3 n=1 Tax=Phytophthora citrophthora TaxID=4793 RepID=A0AAD9GYL3_9STRA|nr:Transcription factor GTE3 [Phytophthora citrophthora]
MGAKRFSVIFESKRAVAGEAPRIHAPAPSFGVTITPVQKFAPRQLGVIPQKRAKPADPSAPTSRPVPVTTAAPTAAASPPTATSASSSSSSSIHPASPKLAPAATIGDPTLEDPRDEVVQPDKAVKGNKSAVFQTERIEVVSPSDAATPWTSGTPRGHLDSSPQSSVHVCVMMVDQQPQQSSAPASKNSNGQAATIKQEPTQVPSANDTNNHVNNITVKTEKGVPEVKQTKSVPNLPREVLQYAPLLVGKYYIQDKRAVWSGMWGMSEAAFGPNGLISSFEMKSQEDVAIPMCSGAADSVHPAMSGSPLARSSRITNAAISEVSPVYFGYETDANVRSAMPFQGKYSGSFQIQAVKGKHQTVSESDVDIRFVHDVANPSQFVVTGSGENRFGRFTLHGFLEKETNELRLYKVYKPKTPVKRSIPRRTRAARAVTPAVKREVKALSISAPGVAAITAVTNVTNIVTPVAGPTIVAPRTVGTPMSDYSSPSLVMGRSERKRSIPAHLREDNILELDHAPMSMKKCLSILKGLMGNVKSAPFMAPVDPVALGIPDYFRVIKEPMDLGTIRNHLESGFYDSPSEFADHVRLTFRNAMLYNAAHSQVHIYARKLLDDFERRFKSLNMKLSTKKNSDLKLKKGDTSYSSKKVRGGKGTKGNTKRQLSGEDTGLIMSLKEDIERLKATLEQLQPSMTKAATSKISKAAAKPFKMEDLTEEELNEPMSQMDKARLSSDIKLLPQDKINRVLQIIAEAVPVAKLANENDEVELDINAFDTRCLRMLEGYVRENGIGRKRKRPTKSAKMAPAEKRLKSAKVAALNIRHRKEELRSELAAIDQASRESGDQRTNQDVTMTDVNGGEAEPTKKEGVVSSDSSSSSSESSDSDSDSDSESDSDDDGGAPLERSPPLASAPSLSQLDPSASVHSVDAAKKIRDEQLSSSEPLRVENRGAWSMLAKKETPNGTPLAHSNDNSQSTSSLWLSARSMEQIKQQKIQQKEKERTDELEAKKRREIEQREKEKEREQAERRKYEQVQAAKLAEEKRLQEERVREAERARLAQLAIEREKLAHDDDVELHDATLSEDLDAFSSSSFFMGSVNDLHKKFEDLNEEISAALRVQQDAVASASTFSGRANLTAARKDALRLAKKTTDWRGDVTALSKHIDLQLQHSRALRSHYAQSLLSSSAQKQQEEAEGSRLRCLRSDLRLLQEFRVQYVRQCDEKDLTLLTAIEEETKQLKAFIDKSTKKEKIGGKQEQSVLALELFEVRRDIMSRISEDFVKEKKQLDVEVGNPDALATDSFGTSNNATAEKDALASWDTQLFISFLPAPFRSYFAHENLLLVFLSVCIFVFAHVILMQTLHELQKEKRERLAAKSRKSVVSFTGVEGLAVESQVASPTKVSSEIKAEMLVEDVHFSMQKLKREVAELKTTNSKLMLANSQLEDDVAHLQAKFDEEKRAHLNGKKWFVPKMQKVSGSVVL